MTVQNPLVPADARLVLRVFREGFHLLLGFGVFRLGDFPERQADGLHLAHEGQSGVHLLAGPFVGFLPGSDDPPCQFFQPVEPAQRAHPLLGGLADHQGGRLVAHGPDPGQDRLVFAVLGPKLLADLMPEVGVDRRSALDFLRTRGLPTP